MHDMHHVVSTVRVSQKKTLRVTLKTIRIPSCGAVLHSDCCTCQWRGSMLEPSTVAGKGGHSVCENTSQTRHDNTWRVTVCATAAQRARFHLPPCQDLTTNRFVRWLRSSAAVLMV